MIRRPPRSALFPYTTPARSTANASITFTLDKTIATPTVALSNDSGSSNSDVMTNKPLLTFHSAAPYVTRSFKNNGAAPAASYTAPSLDGSHTVVVTDTDTAG